MGKLFNSVLVALSGGQLVDIEEKLLSEIHAEETAKAEQAVYTKQAFEDLSKQYEFNVQQLRSKIAEMNRQVSQLESVVDDYKSKDKMVTAPMYSLVSAYITESYSARSGTSTQTNYIFRHNITGEDVLTQGDTKKQWYLRQTMQLWDPDNEVEKAAKKDQD